jgi:hypothetical protein
MLDTVVPVLGDRLRTRLDHWPGQGAAAILTALDTDATPLRLPLGDDAVDAILGHLDSVRTEITTWEKLARNTRLAH